MGQNLSFPERITEERKEEAADEEEKSSEIYKPK